MGPIDYAHDSAVVAPGEVGMELIGLPDGFGVAEVEELGTGLRWVTHCVTHLFLS